MGRNLGAEVVSPISSSSLSFTALSCEPYVAGSWQVFSATKRAYSIFFIYSITSRAFSLATCCSLSAGLSAPTLCLIWYSLFSSSISNKRIFWALVKLKLITEAEFAGLRSYRTGPQKLRFCKAGAQKWEWDSGSGGDWWNGTGNGKLLPRFGGSFKMLLG